MKYQELMTKLTYARQCVSEREIVPLLSQISFMKDKIVSFNGAQGIVVDYVSELECNVPGIPFYRFLETLDVEDIAIQVADNNVVVKTKGALAKFSQASTKDFERGILLPDIKDKTPIKVNKEFFEGLTNCLPTISNNIILQNQSNVTLTNDGIFSTDNIRVSKFQTDLQVTPFKILLPKEFCKISIAIQKDLQTDGNMYIDGNLVIVTFPGITIYTKTVPCTEFLNYEKIIKETIGDSTELVEKPIGLTQILDRCLVLLANDLQKIVSVNVEAPFIEVKASGKYGQYREQVESKFREGYNINFKVDCQFFKDLLSCCDKIYFSKGKGNSIVIIGNEDKYTQLLLGSAE